MEHLRLYNIHLICRYNLGRLLALKFLKISFYLKGNQELSRVEHWLLALFPFPADISTIICDTPQKALVLIDNVEKGLTPHLKLVILMDPFNDDLKERGEKCGLEVLSLLDAEVWIWTSTCRWKASPTSRAVCMKSTQNTGLLCSLGSIQELN